MDADISEIPVVPAEPGNIKLFSGVADTTFLVDDRLLWVRKDLGLKY